MKALVISNEIDTTHLLEVRLKKDGFDAFSAQTGDQGLDQVRKEQPTVVVVDPQVPGEHGMGLVRQLKTASKPEPVVLVLSAEAGIAHIADAFAQGADDFVAQPFSPQGLLERVRVALVRSGRLREEEREASCQ
jgi:DNA-binding response OmpR family regulator